MSRDSSWEPSARWVSRAVASCAPWTTLCRSYLHWLLLLLLHAAYFLFASWDCYVFLNAW